MFATTIRYGPNWRLCCLYWFPLIQTWHNSGKEVTFACTRKKPSWRTRDPNSDAIWLCRDFFYWWSLDRADWSKVYGLGWGSTAFSRLLTPPFIMTATFGHEHRFRTVDKYFPLLSISMDHNVILSAFEWSTVHTFYYVFFWFSVFWIRKNSWNMTNNEETHE